MKKTNDLTKLQKLIKGLERPNFPFKPDFIFYTQIGVKRKRWAQIFRNEKPATIIEIQAIAKYFNVSINDIIEN